VEAIIQLPTDEFFNTNIYTYLWVFNKQKSAERKDKVILINASEKFDLLKKNKGKKRKEVNEQGQREIVDTIRKFQSNDFTKVFDKEFFYYNKQSLMLTNLDENNKSFVSQLDSKKTLKLDPIKITNGSETVLDRFEIAEFDGVFADLQAYNKDFLQPKISDLDYKEQDIKVHTREAIYYFDNEKETLVKEVNGKIQDIGCGIISIKSSYKKGTKIQKDKIVIAVELMPSYQKDYEIIPYSTNETLNKKNIDGFMAKYITRPFELVDNTIGVEINFNKVFYQPEILRPLEVITAEIQELENELHSLESEFGI
jgi:type I restriction enzyme M protein